MPVVVETATIDPAIAPAVEPTPWYDPRHLCPSQKEDIAKEVENAWWIRANE